MRLFYFYLHLQLYGHYASPASSFVKIRLSDRFLFIQLLLSHPMQITHFPVVPTLTGKKKLQQNCYKGPAASLVWEWQTIKACIKACSLRISFTCSRRPSLPQSIHKGHALSESCLTFSPKHVRRSAQRTLGQTDPGKIDRKTKGSTIWTDTSQKLPVIIK